MMLDGLHMVNSLNCGNEEYPQFRMDNRHTGGKGAWSGEIDPVRLACPLSPRGMGCSGCSQAWRSPTKTDSQDDGMDL